MSSIHFRPHHFLCALGYQGKGYSDTFVENFDQIAAQLHTHPDQPIQVVTESDSICKPCPHRRGPHCASEEKIRQLDRAHQTALGLESNQELTWIEAKSLIRDKITRELFHKICAPCEWKPLAICEAALIKNQKEGKLGPNHEI